MKWVFADAQDDWVEQRQQRLADRVPVVPLGEPNVVGEQRPQAEPAEEALQEEDTTKVRQGLPGERHANGTRPKWHRPQPSPKVRLRDNLYSTSKSGRLRGKLSVLNSRGVVFTPISG